MDKRVIRGASLLDQKVPGWEKKINPGTLRIQSRIDCVLGQIFGTYEAGLSAVEPPSALDHGFNAERGIDYNILDHDWREFLRERERVKELTKELAPA